MANDETPKASPLERYLAKQKEQRAKEPKPEKPKVRKPVRDIASTLDEKPSEEVKAAGRYSLGLRKRVAAANTAEIVGQVRDQVTAQTAPQEEADIRIGKLLPRFVAFAIDNFFVFAFSYPFRKAFDAMARDGGEVLVEIAGGLEFFSYFAVVFVYYGYFYKNRGASPGKLLMNLEVVDLADGRHLSYGKAFFREAVGKFISGLALSIGYLIALFRPDRRSLHDLLFDTVVLEKRRAPVSNPNIPE